MRHICKMLLVPAVLLIATRAADAQQPRRRATPAAGQAKQLRQPSQLGSGSRQTSRTTTGRVSPAESKIMSRLSSLEKQLSAHERVLERRLQQAQKLRQDGLKRNDFKMLQKAERLEKQAVVEYEAQIRRFEKISKSVADSANTAANQALRQPPPTQRRPSSNTKSRSSRSYSGRQAKKSFFSRFSIF